MRSTKKYCSDNCKQLAFYKRSGLQLSGVIVKEELFNDKSTSVNDNSMTGNDERITHASPLITGERHAITVNDKSSVTVNTFTIKQQQEEPPYQWEYSSMIDNIVKYAENDQELSMFSVSGKILGNI
ncbi:hypothetical protein [Chitinophaga sp. LS1]|uniref:hypothetical protein n=1 Tax=Chitinophaga sp. LS1 TaxID=3051176 RepID=UPI002AAB5FF5|nr:hypothetical protein [Chitinophaga sp. LS1]WPV65968.1 hypothetical protein QQL36_29645 [Chitinophaga sp. LS1]